MQNSTHWKCTESSCILARAHGEVWVLPTLSDVDLLPTRRRGLMPAQLLMHHLDRIRFHIAPRSLHRTQQGVSSSRPASER